MCWFSPLLIMGPVLRRPASRTVSGIFAVPILRPSHPVSPPLTSSGFCFPFACGGCSPFLVHSAPLPACTYAVHTPLIETQLSALFGYDGGRELLVIPHQNTLACVPAQLAEGDQGRELRGLRCFIHDENIVCVLQQGKWCVVFGAAETLAQGPRDEHHI